MHPSIGGEPYLGIDLVAFQVHGLNLCHLERERNLDFPLTEAMQTRACQLCQQRLPHHSPLDVSVMDAMLMLQARTNRPWQQQFHAAIIVDLHPHKEAAHVLVMVDAH